MIKRDGEQPVIIKGAIPRALKLEFKILCIQKEVEMSFVLECLLKRWIRADAPVDDFPTTQPEQDYEDVKGYVPKSLKLQFKVLCTQKRVKICTVLYKLIHEWVQAGGPTFELC